MCRVLLLAAVAACPLSVHADVRGLSAADLVSLARISEPALAPDGRTLAYTLRETDLSADRGRSDIWLQDIEGGAAARRFTTSEENDSAAAWAPDSSGIFFLSSRSGSPQVWFLAAAGGEASQVTELPVDVGGFRVSPQGDRLALALDVFPDCADLDCTKKRLDERKSAKQRGQAYDQLFIRHWDKWKDGRVSQIFSAVLDGSRKLVGPPLSLTAGVDADVPSRPFGGRCPAQPLVLARGR
jgi:dipeptidyl aminopeptidase/acylaminoacyl peptidase